MAPQLEGTMIVTGAAGFIGTGWLRQHLQSPQAQTHHTIYIVHSSAPGALREILGKEAPPECKYELVDLDLSCQANIQEFTLSTAARVVKGEITEISLLLLIAGALFLDPTTQVGVGITNEGWEKNWAINYAANVRLIMGLLGSMTNTGRVVFLGSSSHNPAFLSNRGTFTQPEMKIIFKGGEGTVERHLSASLSSSLSQLQILAYDPGLVAGTTLTSSLPLHARLITRYVLGPIGYLASPFWTNFWIRTPKRVGRHLVWCCWSDDLKGGEYVDGQRISDSSSESLDRGKQAILWNETANLLGLAGEMAQITTDAAKSGGLQ